MVREVRCVWAGGMTLGEGPMWDSAAGRLWFVDIKQRQIHRLDTGNGQAESWTAPAPIGWVLRAQGGGLIAGLQSGLAHFDAGTGSFRHLLEVEPHLPGNRLNDATVGPDGSIWFGSMDDNERVATGYLYKFDGREVTRVPIMPVVVTNGPAFSPDGGTLYHVDTVGRDIHAVSVKGGSVGRSPRVFARIDDGDGHPDGVSVDAAGNVWVGLWGGGRARCYAPDGSMLEEVGIPATNVTKIAFGGPDLRTAYVTTARIGLSEETLRMQPGNGNVFAFEVEIPGLPLPLARWERRRFEPFLSATETGLPE